MNFPYSPYTPPRVPDDAYRAALPPAATVPAVQAGVMQVIVGVLMLLLGGCFGTMMVSVPPDELVDRLRQSNARLPSDLSPEQIVHAVAYVMWGVGIIGGAAQVILGLLVRRGGRRAVVASLTLNGLLLAVLLLNMLSAVLQAGVDPSSLAANLCVMTFALAILGGLLFFLVGALRPARLAAGRPDGGFPLGPYPPPAAAVPALGYGAHAPPAAAVPPPLPAAQAPAPRAAEDSPDDGPAASRP